MTEPATQPKRRGRPPGSGTGRRRPAMNLTLSEEAKAALQARAEAAGLSQSAWVEHVALHGRLPR